LDEVKVQWKKRTLYLKRKEFQTRHKRIHWGKKKGIRRKKGGFVPEATAPGVGTRFYFGAKKPGGTGRDPSTEKSRGTTAETLDAA